MIFSQFSFLFPACGGNFHTNEGIIHSPGYPGDYSHNRQCIWVIKVDQGKQILLNFTRFDLENHRDCRYDYLEIRYRLIHHRSAFLFTETPSIIATNLGMEATTTLPSSGLIVALTSLLPFHLSPIKSG